MSLTRRRASSVARRQGGADEVDERTADKMMDDLLADMGPSPGQGEGNGPGVRSVRDLSGLHELDGLQCQSHKQEPLKPDLEARFHQAALWAAYMGMKGLVRMAMLERCSTTQVKPLSREQWRQHNSARTYALSPRLPYLNQGTQKPHCRQKNVGGASWTLSKWFPPWMKLHGIRPST